LALLPFFYAVPLGEDAVSTPEEVLSYWFPVDFSNADTQTRQRQMQRWMAGGPEVDMEITERFGEVLEQARRGELNHWADTARGRLALIVVLGQFSRNVYRGSPLSYAQDEKACQLALEGIELGMDRELSERERFFFWLPVGHSEDLTLQERSVLHAEEDAANAPSHLRAGAEFGVSQAKGVRDVIARFGRHPHGNEFSAATPHQRNWSTYESRRRRTCVGPLPKSPYSPSCLEEVFSETHIQDRT
jgi:uncharacterized protein (DUF924 family)